MDCLALPKQPVSEPPTSASSTDPYLNIFSNRWTPPPPLWPPQFNCTEWVWENSHISPFRLRIHLDKDEEKEGSSTVLVRLKALVITILMLTVVFVLLSIMIYLFSFLNWLRGSDLESLLMWLLFYNPFIQTSVLASFL